MKQGRKGAGGGGAETGQARAAFVTETLGDIASNTMGLVGKADTEGGRGRLGGVWGWQGWSHAVSP